MKREHIDWKVLRGSIIFFIVSLLAGGSLIGGSFYFKEEMKKEYIRNNAQFRTISNKYLAVDEEEKLIINYYPKFVELYEKGIIGREQRLNWIEVLRDGGNKIRLPSLGYEISSQKPYQPAYSLNLGRFKLNVSDMKLNMQLLHEGDLFSLLDALNRNANGIYTVNSCQFAKTGSIVTDNPEAANITANCELEWYTIKLADGTEIQV